MNTTKWKLAAVTAAGALLLLTGCSDSGSNIPQKDKKAEANFKKQQKTVPAPSLTDSLERRNIVEHLNRNNQPNRIQYIYLLSDVGTIYAYFPIKGKVTSAGAQLSPTDSIVDPCSTDYCPTVVQGPSDDGSFGSNEGGIYFFTQDGVEIQWDGRWLLSDSPLKIESPGLTLSLPPTQ